jgi:hypothetical protein
MQPSPRGRSPGPLAMGDGRGFVVSGRGFGLRGRGRRGAEGGSAVPRSRALKQNRKFSRPDSTRQIPLGRFHGQMSRDRTRMFKCSNVQMSAVQSFCTYSRRPSTGRSGSVIGPPLALGPITPTPRRLAWSTGDLDE